MSKADRKAKFEDAKARIKALSLEPTPAYFDQTARAERSERARLLLHEAFALFRRQRNRPDEEALWRESVALNREILDQAYPAGFWDNYSQWRRGESQDIDIAISFLESDPWFFRTGYIKADLIHYLRRIELSAQQIERLRAVVLIAIDSRDRREFRSYCKLAKRLYSNDLKKEVERRVSSEDAGIRRRARWVLSAITHNKVFHLNLGCSKEKSKQYAEAVGHFTRAIYLEPACVRAYLCRSRVYVEMNKVDLAIDDLTRIIELSDHPFVETRRYGDSVWVPIRHLKADAYRDRAEIFEQRGETELAIADYSRVLNEKPRDDFALGRRGRLYFETGKFDDCLEDFNRRLLGDANNGYSYYWRGRAYTAKKQYDLAVDEFVLALALNPKDHFSLTRLSQVYELMGKRQEARQCADEAKQIWETGDHSTSS